MVLRPWTQQVRQRSFRKRLAKVNCTLMIGIQYNTLITMMMQSIPEAAVENTTCNLVWIGMRSLPRPTVARLR